MQYRSKCNIVRVTKSKDSIMSSTEVESVLHNDLPCKVQWINQTEQPKFSQEDVKVVVGRVYCRVVDIINKDRIVIDGTTYEIIAVRNVAKRNRKLRIDFALLK
jgi:hypothetical protein